MKCTNTTPTWREDIVELCSGEMKEIGKIPKGEIDSPIEAKLYQVMRTLYQCDVCKTIKLN